MPEKSMCLYSGPLSMFGAKAEIAALEKGLDVEVIMVPFDMDRLYEPKHPEILRVNPKRQVPVLLHGETEIFEFDADFRIFGRVEAGTASMAAGRGGARQGPPPRAQIRRGLLSADHPPDVAAGPPWRSGSGCGLRCCGPLLWRDGGRAGARRLSCRFLFLRRYRFLYGAAFRRAHGRAHDGSDAEASSLARAPDGETGHSPGGGSDGAFSPVSQASAAGLHGRASA